MMSKFIESKTRAEAIERMDRDWAKIVKVCGGYMFFDTLADYNTWRGQK
jgi:hypothetical protein